jgi:hypothetical protein
MVKWNEREITKNRINYIINLIEKENKTFGDINIWTDNDVSYFENSDSNIDILFSWRLDITEKIKKEELKNKKTIPAYLYRGSENYFDDNETIYFYFNSKFEIPRTTNDKIA